jgi:hypothetical protein
VVDAGAALARLTMTAIAAPHFVHVRKKGLDR